MLSQERNEIQGVNTKQKEDLITQIETLNQKNNELADSITSISAEKEDMLKDNEYLKKDIERNNETKEKLDKQVGCYFTYNHRFKNLIHSLMIKKLRLNPLKHL